MRQYVGTVGPKGQVTLPIEVRKELGISPSDKVIIVVKAGSAVVRRQSSLLEGYRSIRAKKPGTLTDDDITRIAQEEAVRDFLREDEDTDD
jgi:AbrB family looped-hinge helix DNA binding protein